MIRRRKVFTLALLGIILTCLGIVLIELGNRGSENNFFHRQVKEKVISVDWFRNLLRLQDSGDARFALLHGSGPLRVRIVPMEGIELDVGVWQQLSRSISKMTGRNVSYTVTQFPAAYAPQVPEDGLDTLLRHFDENVPRDLTIYLLSRNETRPTLIGLTYRDRGAVVYYDTILEDVNNNVALASRYTLSTALHEIGHQFGLDHNETEGCLMNAKAEIRSGIRGSVDTIIVDFCEAERAEIRAKQKR